ncbi:MAG: glycosyltransferase family 1 protein [Zymomonas mobilis subsp. pomaceae]|uniref:Glycosyl transferase group 1 n=1 Tax=Zymomonas mobilis subsp. pomaceae (strain ATCC 29192 / DSM 22645 / JCM 10191 / CCUG 17912 / NBRC 13757 / NCIMB 11200 / NRRL B-4491 / Barker I) TaxID=579138 RepID=F8ESK4_ZYMMT|nr:glycosyltransferase family 1 protein [Zymomonas mobilis]AEI37779.1 glycosyl transferase group 1 [Zymomonas mobilis subsp. pomaceae ATCC 29192]MDX5949146.1 glycosyltransferase family 1 protein [Zymomonas mobilis subsp. pomaceae]GEB88953.1 glycosyl transferase [Zymomonas mobilis subsp. pomaceae]
MAETSSSDQALDSKNDSQDGEIILDLSWLTQQARCGFVPDGISRIEIAWAKLLIGWFSDRISFGRLNNVGHYGHLSQGAVLKLIEQTEKEWQKANTQSFHRPLKLAFNRVEALFKLWPHRFNATNGIRILLQCSPHHLDDGTTIKNIIQKEQARFVCLLHDTEALDYPEYIKPQQFQRLQRRLKNIAQYADCIISDSEATRNRFLPFMAEAGRTIPITTVPLGADGMVSAPTKQNPPIQPKSDKPERPYFLCIGPIHDGTNYEMLFAIWKRLISRWAEKTPDLLIVGQDKGENLRLKSMLMRNPVLQKHIHFLGACNDQILNQLILQARALLKPSIFTHQGLSIAEALRHGLPVIASDLPVYREISSNMADYIDPLNGSSWEEAITDYMAPFSPRRQTQVMRLKGWHPILWQDHMRKVLAVIAG